MDTLVVSWCYLVDCAGFGDEVWARDDGEMVRLPKGSDPLYRGELVELVLCEEHDDVEIVGYRLGVKEKKYFTYNGWIGKGSVVG